MSKLSKIVDNIDWRVITIVFFIIFIGLLCLYSATNVLSLIIFWKQVIWVGLGVFVMLVAFIIDYRTLMRMAWPIYVITIILLVLVLCIGNEIAGARRWFSIGTLGFQPSEVAKGMVIILIAFYGAKKKHIDGYGLRDLLLPFVVLLVPTLLILAQPDLGTAGIIVLIAICMFFVIGIKKSAFVTTLFIMIGLLPVAWLSLKDYQQARILSFLDPNRDPLGTGYHAIQSKIAVGSGGLLGKGFLHGTQTQLMFLPEHHTDFIFSVVAEEWGFIGSAVVISLYLLLITRIVSVGIKAKDRFGAILCFGIAIYFTLHVFMNIAMAIGLAPVVGVPLPFISYGGSFMLVNMACIGIVLSVSWRRFFS
ncbi:MAG: rod shape-determining protein RodA [Thermodesulfobacteriota bacterium]|nr:rod shape-determining protein RodA [Thermodesulfobacteriota bacterium]